MTTRKTLYSYLNDASRDMDRSHFKAYNNERDALGRLLYEVGKNRGTTQRNIQKLYRPTLHLSSEIPEQLDYQITDNCYHN